MFGWTSIYGHYNEWSSRKEYSVTVSSADEEFIDFLKEYLENKLKDALKKHDYDAVSNIASEMKQINEQFGEAIIQAENEYQEFVKKDWEKRKAEARGLEGDANAE